MGMAQVPDRSKQAATFGLRAVFAGIGRLLLLADRPEGSLSGTDTAPGGSADPRHRSASSRQARPRRGPAAQPNSRWRSLDKTGNVRLLSAEDLDEEFDDDEFYDGDLLAADEAVDDEVLDTELPDVELPEVAPPEEALPEEALAKEALHEEALPAEELPLASYDELSFASIRARLRNLDVSQLRILADYERRNAERPEVLGMLERRIEKLEAGG
jgi:hypothetical protein